MKLSKIFLMSACVALGLSSCVSEDITKNEPQNGKKEGSGRLLLNVGMVDPTATRAESVAPDTYPLTIANNESILKSYDSWKDFPTEGLKMDPGTYVAQSHTPGEMARQQQTPYYFGEESFNIVDQLSTDVEVVCKMANGKITIKLGENFNENFNVWSLTIDDGGQGILSFDSENNQSGDFVYWNYYEGVKVLKLNFEGKTRKDNVDVSTCLYVKKEDAKTGYDDDDSDTFKGGDCLEFTINPKANTAGQISGINLIADISFANGGNDQDITLDVYGEPINTFHITLDKPSNMRIDGDTDPSLGDTYIAATTGLKSILVTIESTNSGMVSSLGDLKTQYGVDFINGAEIVDDEGAESLLGSLGITSIPSEGDLEYTFPIGNFFGMLSALGSGVHTFTMLITDLDGCTAQGKIVLVVGEGDVPADEDVINKEAGAGITLELPDDMAIDGDTDPSLGDTYIAATTGLKSILVTIESTNSGMVSSLGDLKTQYGVDFINGAEIVDDEGAENLLSSLGITSVPSEGDLEYTFPIGNFFGMLSALGSGVHTFTMKVTAMDGAVKEGNIVLTVN